MGVLVFAVVVLRAAVQSVTIDEADTYLVWVQRGGLSFWEPASNNHQLNSMVMALAVWLFGPSNLTVRASAILGAALYIACAVIMTRRFARNTLSGIALFLCLTANPFVLDYLVAARGYSMAMAFLLLALTGAALPISPIKTCALGSAAVALAVASTLPSPSWPLSRLQ